MAKNNWKWADLNDDQVEQLHEGEQTLGADILLAYEQIPGAMSQEGKFPPRGFKVAPLNDSQLECLQGLERNIHAVVIAYQKD